MKFELVDELKAAGYSQRKALGIAGVSRSAMHYRSTPRPRVQQPIAHKDRDYPSRISDADQATIVDLIRSGWARGRSVLDSFATAWDQGTYLGSQRQWYRIANLIADQSQRPPRPARRRRTRQPPVVVATAPGQVWMWDITDLKATFVGQVFKAYSIQDLYSRKIIAFCVVDREHDDCAAALFAEAFDTQGAPETIHSDNGAVMRSHKLADLCAHLGVAMSFSRPSVSNDNPYKESEFRTMKTRPTYPGLFGDLAAARAWVGEYVRWFNTEHHHSGIALFSPQSVHDGTWTSRYHARVTAIDDYYNLHPERFQRPPTVARPAQRVGINLHHAPTTPVLEQTA